MNNEIFKQYIILVDFLGGTLGQDYEVALYNLENGNNTLIAASTANAKEFSLGEKLPDEIINLLNSDVFSEKDYCTNYPGKNNTISVYRNSYMLIKNTDGSIIGLLCIIFDDTRFMKLHDYLISVAHPLDFVKNYSYHTVHNLELYESDSNEDKSPDTDVNLQNLMNTCYRDALRSANIHSDRFTSEERLTVIKYLKEYCFFRMKGSVQYAAKHLGCSTASIYRYLSDLKE